MQHSVYWFYVAFQHRHYTKCIHRDCLLHTGESVLSGRDSLNPQAARQTFIADISWAISFSVITQQLFFPQSSTYSYTSFSNRFFCFCLFSLASIIWSYPSWSTCKGILNILNFLSPALPLVPVYTAVFVLINSMDTDPVTVFVLLGSGLPSLTITVYVCDHCPWFWSHYLIYLFSTRSSFAFSWQSQFFSKFANLNFSFCQNFCLQGNPEVSACTSSLPYFWIFKAIIEIPSCMVLRYGIWIKIVSLFIF